jgi:hypothetical protein
MAETTRVVDGRPFSNEDEARFWQKVDRRGGPDACWPWMAGRLVAGYGHFRFKTRTLKAHRVAWEIANGPIPAGSGWHGTVVMHVCDNPACCNARHLRLGTHRDNIDDMLNKGRQPMGDSHHARQRPERLARGISNGNAKLTETTVREIRALHASGVSCSEIAARFGIGKSQAWRIGAGLTWRHVT